MDWVLSDYEKDEEKGREALDGSMASEESERRESQEHGVLDT